ncbi:hypothetical protein Bbelb_141320 [Branchiostoma belcheri]|nr:hypothetical protein Bbelb_141320 [Branchiostoma belcheri]
MVDCKLVTLKLYYFLFFGGIACFVPYISVYLRQLGLLSYQAGIISGTYPFFTFLLKPILGAVADKFDRHKQTLMLCLFLTYCLMFSTMFVPPVKRGEPQISTDCFSCFAMDNFSERRQNQDETDYSVTFYMFAGFGTATLLTVAFGFEKWRKLIRKIGHQQVFQLALFCYAVKFLSYSLIPSPWWVLAIEPLHGITFGAMFSASVTYASLIAPPGMETTMQSIVSAVQFGVGYASGSLIGGAIFHAFGGVVLFRTYAVVCLVSCILYRLIPRCLTRYKDEVASQGSQHGDSGEEQDDPRTEISSKYYETILENANVTIYTETSV